MDKKVNEEGLQSRREFFKKAAKTALPLFGLAILGPSLLSSCDKDEEDEPEHNGCGNSCSGSCEGSCSGSCSSGCDTGCDGSCYAGCLGR